MVLTISRLPQVAAGPDRSVCPGTLVYINDATATNWEAAEWYANSMLLLTDPDSLELTYPVPPDATGNIWMNITVYGTDGCADRTASDSLLLTVKPVPAIDAGPDMSIAPGTSVTLDATIAGGSGAFIIDWEPAQLLIDATVEDPASVPINEDTRFTMTVLDLISGCSVYDSMFVDVDTYKLPPVAVVDYDSTLMNIPVLINPMENDYDPNGGMLQFQLLEGPYNGNISRVSDSIFNYQPYPNFKGVDSIMYYIYDNDPVPQTDTAMIYIVVGEEIPLDIYNVITPNGDGLNETFTINGIENYPNNTVLIFNRWGDKIRSFNGYDNSAVVWDGTNRHGEPVPDGTYFYVISLEYVGTYQGWIFVRANSD
jgi:gliding motility-associated-like protein